MFYQFYTAHYMFYTTQIYFAEHPPTPLRKQHDPGGGHIDNINLRRGNERAVEPRTHAAVEPRARAAVEPRTRAAVEPRARAAVEPRTRAAIDTDVRARR